MKVYVVGYEANNTDGISFWDWYYKENKAMNRIAELNTNSELKGIIYHGVVEVKEGETNITDFVERFLEENDWENSFN